MPKYIEVTQDGCARLIRGVSPADIEGIYTDGLLSCIAIIIVGKNGVALIHDTMVLSVDSIVREFDSVGNVSYWTIAFNPEHHKRGSEQLKAQINRFHRLVIDRVGAGKHLKISAVDQDLKLYEAKYGFVSISLKGSIEVSVRPTDIISPPNVDERYHLINVPNSWFLGSNENINADLQFDGSNFTNMPLLNKTRGQRNQLLTTSKFLIPGYLAHTETLLERIKVTDLFLGLLNKYKLPTENLLPSLELAIHRASVASQEDHRSLLDVQCKVEAIKIRDEICFRYKLAYPPSSAELERALIQARAENHIRDIRFLESYIEKKKLETVLSRYKLKKENALPTPEVALRRAACEGPAVDVQLLIGKVQNINLQDDNPKKLKTALHWAVTEGRKENVGALLAAGAKDDIPDATEKTAKDYAMQSSDEEMKSLFQSSAPRIKR